LPDRCNARLGHFYLLLLFACSKYQSFPFLTLFFIIFPWQVALFSTKLTHTETKQILFLKANSLLYILIIPSSLLLSNCWLSPYFLFFISWLICSLLHLFSFTCGYWSLDCVGYLLLPTKIHTHYSKTKLFHTYLFSPKPNCTQNILYPMFSFSPCKVKEDYKKVHTPLFSMISHDFP
jgi:hypothetical protein